jgi:hypothetical protein
VIEIWRRRKLDKRWTVHPIERNEEGRINLALLSSQM